MKFGIVLAFGLAAAPLAFAQQQGTNPGDTKKDAETADAQHNAPKGKAAVKEMEKQQNDTTANAGKSAPAANQELSTEQVRKEKKKAMRRARAMKQQREEKGTSNWNTLHNPQSDKAVQSGNNAGVTQPPASGGSTGTGTGGGTPAGSGSGR
jgi:hypothetical protein